MVFAATSFGAMAYSAKIASKALSGPEVAFFRMAVGLLPCVLVPRIRRAALGYQRLDLILYRGIFGGIAVMLYFLAIEHTSAGLATLLNYTAPIWSGMFSLLFIGERISPRVLIPLPVALTGVYLVVHASHFDVSRWLLAGLLSAVFSGAAVTAMRAARRAENSWSVYASFCFFGMIVNTPLTIVTWRTPSGSTWIALASTAVFAMAAQLLMTFSLRWVDAMTVGVISQLAVLVATALGALFLHEEITGAAALGSALTICGVIGVTYVTSLGRADAIEVVSEA
jgi:drug/metabolite transporter (DMT)-like permease